MSPAVYVTRADTGFVHLGDDASLNVARSALCGRRLRAADVIGLDETISGIRADCRDCRGILKARNR